MTYQCPQCGNKTEQSSNFCRKCGAPMQTISLTTVPLTTVPTSVNPAVKKEFDPSNTLEPQPVPATDVLTEPVTAAITKPTVTTTLPPTQTAGLPVAAAAPLTSAKPRSNKGSWMIVAAAALFCVGSLGYYALRRTNAPVVENAVAEVATPTPVPGATPEEVVVAVSPTPAVVEAVTPSPIPDKANVNAKVTPMVKTETNATPKASLASATNPYATPVNAAAAPTNPALLENPASLIEQGNRFAGAGQFQDAIRAYDKARRVSPGNADVYYLIGSAYHRSGDLTNALEAYRKCTSGNYASVAANHVKNLEKKISKAK
jgi:hypothetical protein